MPKNLKSSPRCNAGGGFVFVTGEGALRDVEYLRAVAVGERDVEPAVALLVDQLVEDQPRGEDQIEELLVALRAAGGDVGGLAPHVLRGGRAAHGPVECRAAVAVVDDDRRAPSFADRIEELVHQPLELDLCLGRRGVVDALGDGGVGAGELLEGEMVGHWLNSFCTEYRPTSD